MNRKQGPQLMGMRPPENAAGHRQFESRASMTVAEVAA